MLKRKLAENMVEKIEKRMRNETFSTSSYSFIHSYFITVKMCTFLSDFFPQDECGNDLKVDEDLRIWELLLDLQIFMVKSFDLNLKITTFWNLNNNGLLKFKIAGLGNSNSKWPLNYQI